MECDHGSPLAEALGAPAEPPQRPLLPEAEGAVGPAWPREPGAAESMWDGPRWALRVVYVVNESPQAGGALGPVAGVLPCLVRACEAEGAQLTSVPLEELDVGGTAVLDAFYNAGETDVPFTPIPLLSALLPLPPHAMAAAPPYPSTPPVSSGTPDFRGGESSIIPFSGRKTGYRHLDPYAPVSLNVR